MNTTTTTTGNSDAFSTNYYSVDSKFSLKEDARFLIEVLNSDAGQDTKELADTLLHAALVDIFEVECGCDHEEEEDDIHEQYDQQETEEEDKLSIKVRSLKELLELLGSY